MAHVAVITSGSIGFLNASFEVMARLQAEGHMVTALSCLDVRETVQKQGFEYRQLPKINFQPELHDPRGNKAASWKHRFLYHLKYAAQLKENGPAMLELDGYHSVLDELRPDFALVNMELHEAIFTLMELKIPFKLLSSWYNFYRVKGLPPIRRLIIPGVGLNGSAIGIAYGWAYVKAKIYGRYFFDILLFKNYRRIILKQYARKLNYPIADLIHRNFPSVFIHRNLPILTMTLKELELPHKVPQRFTYIGPMVYASRKQEIPDHVQIRLKKIFELKEKQGFKLIYCSVSSNKKADEFFLRKVVQAVGDMQDRLLVISGAGKLSKEFFRQIPKNVFVFNWLPQLNLLEHADCSINHAGGHAISECIHFSVPMLVYSGGEYDQNGCAARLAYHGAGILGDRQQDSVDTIKEKIDRIFEDAAYRKKMEELHQLYKSYAQLELTPLLFNH